MRTQPGGHRWQGASPTPFWLDDQARPAPRRALEGVHDADLVVIGGGFTGLWSALRALEEDPTRSVVLVDGARIAEHASGRNGGFCVASLTHGDPNGRARWPNEMPLLRRLGRENLREIIAAIDRYGISCDLEATGELTVAVALWQAAELEAEAEELDRAGVANRFLNADEIREEIRSPLISAGLLEEGGAVILNPAKLAWGLAAAIEQLGGTIFEGTHVGSVQRAGNSMLLSTDEGSVRARQVIVATSAFPPLVKRTAGRVVPVYDYVLMTEPLTDAQLAAIGWRYRRGLSDAGNQFHYLRLSADNRILFGGYEAVYRYNQRVDPAFDQDPHVFGLLEEHFDAMFPGLRDVAFTHRWGGAIDTSTRFCAAAMPSHDGRVVTINGFTGLGVGSSRFFAGVALDLLNQTRSAATLLEMIRSAPLPFPPEPLRFVGIEATRRAIARADANHGRRGLWLKALDAVGLGFDS